MSLADILKSSKGANISVNIGLSDLRQFLDEVAENKIAQIEQVNQKKKVNAFLTPKEACEMLNVSNSTLTRWKKSGYLTPIKIGGSSRYDKSLLQSIINAKQ